MTQFSIATHALHDGVSVPGPMRLTPFVENSFEHDEESARQWSEAPDRIYEWCKYEYELPVGCSFEPHLAVEPSPTQPNRGVLCARNYVGRLRLKFRDNGLDVPVGYVELECATKKLGYRDQYRLMLNEIAEGATRIYELLMDSSEFAFGSYQLDPNASAQTVYQRFAFLRSLLDGDSFRSSLMRILTQPVRTMRSEMDEARPSSLRHITPSLSRQIAQGGGVACRWVSVDRRVETVDTNENRFVKRVLRMFADCVSVVSRHANASEMLKAEAARLDEEISYWLSSNVMREVSDVDEIGVPSIALQRRDGYRDVLKAWLMFDFSSSLQWSGGDDVFSAGTKDVAQLYEYWVFFKLLSIVGEEFKLSPEDVRDLLVPSEGGIDLMLKKGTTRIVRGLSGGEVGRRPLRVEFTYNRPFKSGSVNGSWTVDMVPDYTLTLWPAEIGDEAIAAKEDLLVHVHFDAKYRIDQYSQIFRTATREDDTDVTRTFPRDTLLKMHAYNDAVKRTYGSYVLYPGNDSARIKRRYHEILPGVGAFVLRPDSKDEEYDCREIRKFVHDVRLALEDRMTQRERVAVYRGKVHNELPRMTSMRGVLLPERTWDGRPFVPAEQYCLIGFCRKGSTAWIEENGYNFRLGNIRGELQLTPEVLNAEYILLHHADLKTNMLYRIDKHRGMRIANKAELVNKNYPGDPHGDIYLMMHLLPIGDTEPLAGTMFDIGKLNHPDTNAPFVVSIQSLIQNGLI